MKLAFITAALVAVASSFSVADKSGLGGDPALEQCIAERCPTEYQKCLATSGCKEKLEKCEAKCGVKIDYTCWSLCIAFPGAAANVANCAVKQGCLASGQFGEIIQGVYDLINN